MAIELDTIYCEDCLRGLKRVEPGSIDLAFADPPFNIGYDYDVYDDRKGYEQYLDWTRQWTAAVVKTLTPTGAFWVAIGDEYAAEMKLILQNDCGLVCRSWVVWYYTFGVHCKYKFTRSHAHLFHFVKDAKKFTFNHDDIRVPSARQLVYADKRAVSKGRVPDDTWILRPQDVPEGFAPGEDTWYFSRVCGTFKERQGWHGCQMPEQLLGRIIKACSHPGETVLDPFGGSGTTPAAAKKLGRRYVAFDISHDYVNEMRRRLRAIKEGNPLVGPADPLSSAPTTGNGRARPEFAHVARVLGARSADVASRADGASNRPSPEHARTCQRDVVGDELAVLEAYVSTHDGFSSDRVLADPELNAAFQDACRAKGVKGGPRDWNRLLLTMRKNNRLSGARATRRTSFRREELDGYKFASEIAMGKLLRGRGVSLDQILCDPQLAGELDDIAAQYAPGHTPLAYRWAALRIRKERKDAREQAASLPADLLRLRLDFRGRRLAQLDTAGVPEAPGVYLVFRSSDKRRLYIGETRRLSATLCETRCGTWARDEDVAVRYRTLREAPSDLARCGLQFRLIEEYVPLLNWLPTNTPGRAA